MLVDSNLGLLFKIQRNFANPREITEMNLILNVASKFQQIGPADTNDNTAKVEAKIQRRLLQLSNDGVMHESVYKKIRPTGSLRPRLYGLPKVHKKDSFIHSFFILDHHNNSKCMVTQ